MSEPIRQAEERPKKSSEVGGLDMLDEFERKLAGEAGYGGSMQISTKAHVLAVDSSQGYVSLYI